MKFPERTPQGFISCVEGNNILDLEEELIENFFQVKAWRLFPNGNSLGIQISFSFHTSDGVGIEPMPVFPEKGTTAYEETKAKIVSIFGFVNLKSEDLSEDQFRILSSLQKKDAKPIQLYGDMMIRFKPKFYTGKDGVEREIVEINIFPNLENFRVGKALTYDLLKGKGGKLPPSLLRRS